MLTDMRVMTVSDVIDPMKAILGPSSAAQIDEMKNVLSPISENKRRVVAAKKPLGAFRFLMI